MEKYQQDYSRRKFILSATGAGAAMLCRPFSSWAVYETDPRVATIVTKTIGIDAHNHIDVPLNAAELPGPAIDLADHMKKSGLSAICMTFAVDYQKLTKEGEAYEKFINGLNAMDVALKSSNIHRSLNDGDIKAAHKEQRPTVIQSVEGGHFLEGQIDRLTIAYQRGLRHLGLLHDNDASVPLGDIYTKPSQWGGLTAFGADVIRQCDQLGILVDLTHCSNETVNAALKVTANPIILSHTGLDTQTGQNANMANMMRPRLISKEQAKIVADAGGVIGVWKHLADSTGDYARNIKAMVNAAGIDHVCLGTDSKLTPAYRAAGNNGPGRNGSPSDNSASGNQTGGPDSNNRPRAGDRTNELWPDQQTGFYYTVVEAMLREGFTEKQIGKIGGENFLRVFDAVTKDH